MRRLRKGRFWSLKFFIGAGRESIGPYGWPDEFVICHELSVHVALLSYRTYYHMCVLKSLRQRYERLGLGLLRPNWKP